MIDSMSKRVEEIREDYKKPDWFQDGDVEAQLKEQKTVNFLLSAIDSLDGDAVIKTRLMKQYQNRITDLEAKLKKAHDWIYVEYEHEIQTAGHSNYSVAMDQLLKQIRGEPSSE